MYPLRTLPLKNSTSYHNNKLTKEKQFVDWQSYLIFQTHPNGNILLFFHDHKAKSKPLLPFELNKTVHVA